MGRVIGFPKVKSSELVGPQEFIYLADEVGQVVLVNKADLHNVMTGETTAISLGETTLRLLITPVLTELFRQL